MNTPAEPVPPTTAAVGSVSPVPAPQGEDGEGAIRKAAAKAKIKLDLANARKIREEAAQIRRERSYGTIFAKALISAVVGLGALSIVYDKYYVPISSIAQKEAQLAEERSKFELSVVKADLAPLSAQNEALRREAQTLQKEIDDARQARGDLAAAKLRADAADKRVKQLEGQVDASSAQGAQAAELKSQLERAKRDAATATKAAEAAQANAGRLGCATLARSLFPQADSSSLQGDATKIARSAMDDMNMLSPKDFGVSEPVNSAARTEYGFTPEEVPVARISAAQKIYITDRGVRYKKDGAAVFLDYDKLRAAELKPARDEIIVSPSQSIPFKTDVHRATFILELRNLLALRSACLEK